LPITEYAGTVKTINASYSTEQGQIVVTSGSTDYTYYYPKRAGTSLSVGDSVEQFQLLADGTGFHDYISSPQDIQSIGITEIEKYHTILLDFDLIKIDPVKLPEASKFVERIKPTFKKKIVRGILSVVDEEIVEEDFIIDITQSLVDPFCSFPQPRYDHRFYVDRHDFDYAYDQFTDDFLPSGGLSSINSSQDGVPSAVLVVSRDFNHSELSSVHGDNTLREFLTGVVELTSGSANASGTADVYGETTDFAAEISPTLSSLTGTQELFVILQPYYEGTGASATQYSNLLVGSAGDFDDIAEGDVIVLKGLQIDSDSDGTPDTDSPSDNGSFMVAQTFGAGSDRIELTHAFVNRPTATNDTYTSISWIAYKNTATAVKVSSVTNASTFVLNTAVPAAYDPDGPTKYLATMVHPDFLAIYYDYFEEYCPNENTTLYFGSDFSHSSNSASVTAVYQPVGISYPPTQDGTITFPSVGSQIDYTAYNRFYNYETFSITTDSANRDEITIHTSLYWTLKVGDWIAFPLLPNSSARNGLTAEDATGTTQSEDEVVFTTETLANSSISPDPHYMGFSWHRVTSITGSYSATNPQITPSLSTDIGTQTTVNSGLIHITHPDTAAGIAIGTLSTGSSPFTLTFKYAGNVGSYTGDYDPDDSARSDERIVTGMFLLAIQETPDWDSTADEVYVILEVTDGEHTATANPNEYEIEVRIWKGSSHSSIVSSFSNTNSYQLCPVDFAHPLQQDNSLTQTTQHTTNNIASKKGMSEIFDVHSTAGAQYNSTEVVVATSGSKEDGTISYTIVEAAP